MGKYNLYSRQPCTQIKIGFDFSKKKNTQWSIDYFVIKLDGKVLCLVCSDIIAVLKE